MTTLLRSLVATPQLRSWLWSWLSVVAGSAHGPPPPPAPAPIPAPPSLSSSAPPTRAPCRARPRVGAGTLPPLARLHQAALARSPVDARAVRRWQRSARVSGVLPDVSVGWDHRRDRGYDLGQMAGEADELSSDLFAGNTFRVRADWSLDRLVFNPDELRAARAALDWLDWRAQLLERVTAIHTEYALVSRQRDALAAEGVCGEALNVLDARLDELAGQMLALTGIQL